MHQSLPFVARYRAAVSDCRPTASGAVAVPDLRAVPACAAAGAGLAVVLRCLCAEAPERGDVVVLGEPPVAPLRTYFLVTRTGALVLPHIARAREWFLDAASDGS